MTMDLSARDVTTELVRAASVTNTPGEQAFPDTLLRVLGRAEIFGEAGSVAHGATPLVLTSAELHTRARQNVPDPDAAFAAYDAALDPHLDFPTHSASLTGWLWDAAGLLGPAAVLGFASLHYPNTTPDARTPAEAQALDLVRATLREKGAELGVTVSERPFFTGSSDMSWFGTADAADIAVINTPAPYSFGTLPPAGIGAR